MRRLCVPTILILLPALLANMAQAQTPVSTAFTYQGFLEAQGSPENGEFDFRFRLYDAASNGNAVGAEIAVDDLPVTGGQFVVQLDFGSGAFNGDARWLEIDLRPGVSLESYTTLTPRQELTAAPYAHYAMNGPASGGGFWSANGTHIYNNNGGHVGIGHNAPSAPLHVLGNGQNIAVRVENSRTAGSFSTSSSSQLFPGVKGISTATGGNAVGVQGITDSPQGFAINGWATGGGYAGFFQGRSYFSENVGVGTPSPIALLDVVAVSTNAGNNTARFSAPNIGPRTSHIHWGTNGDWYIRSAVGGAGKVVLQDDAGKVDIGPVSGFAVAKVNIFGDSAYIPALNAQSNHDGQPAVLAHNAGRGPGLQVTGGSDVAVDDGGVLVVGFENSENISIDNNEIMARNNDAPSTLYLNNEGGDVRIGQNGGSTTVFVPVLAITGADLAEKFPISDTLDAATPGTVMEIDPGNAGMLRVARGAYNRRVAGVVSGAGGLSAGAVLGNLPGSEDAPAIALSGRVWVRCDASRRAIRPGDLLTTSDRAGYAMAVIDHRLATGAVIGKAMSHLSRGETGSVLVLVNLQ